MDDRLRVRTLSWMGGGFFSIGWWIFIDAVSQNQHLADPLGVKAQLVLLPVGATLAFLIMSFMDHSSLNADEYTHHNGRMVRYQARALFGFAIVLSLTCVIVASVVLSNVYINKEGIKGIIPDSNYPGSAILVNTIFTLLATGCMMLARVSDDF
eukprot:CAMPEP_0184511768 /NCGR_PEP_ID=MMETSP0198_2-20121128/2526_1 /TAXON_ID=1112570 /ORGANISM="Thraustochytrium sp., Strain LLF1b" /LENGTH=153 /DNA_ID=CAMNT_0026901753 /DNA_START=107 /DNA_END=568 /DNA_ORIENTATION=-